MAPADAARARLASPVPVRAELVARARALAPVLMERAERTERNRSLLPETADDFRAAGLWRMLQPRDWGGFGLDVATHVEVVAEIARGCASSAWVLSLVSQQNFLASAFPEEARREICGGDGHLVLALTMGPAGRAEPAPGGYRLQGRWPYVSGIDQCTWVALTSFNPERSEVPKPLSFLVPKESCTTIDDWHVLGLRGTGSKTVVLDGVFVPEHRTVSFAKLARDTPVPEGPTLAGVPIVSLFAMVVAAAAPGIARAAVAAFEERIKTRRNAFMTAVQAQYSDAQVGLAQAAARAEAAYLMLMADAEDISRRIAAGEHIDVRCRTRYRLNMAEVLRICSETVTALFLSAGTGAVFDSSLLQRHLRDMLTLRSHVAVEPGSSAENFGRVLLDLPPNPPFI